MPSKTSTLMSASADDRPSSRKKAATLHAVIARQAVAIDRDAVFELIGHNVKVLLLPCIADEAIG